MIRSHISSTPENGFQKSEKMVDLVIQNSAHAVPKIIADLISGREKATRLRNLLNDPHGDHGGVSAEDLARQILNSFADSLSAVSSGAESIHTSAVDGGDSACSHRSKKRPDVKNRRGCYKRRRTGDICEKITEVGVEDGYQWRKYGQKKILNSEFPRCYYRCTHKPQQGCNAVKQVQQMKRDGTILYHTTYFNLHTCTQTPSAIVDACPPDHHLLSFRVSDNVATSQPVDQCPRPIGPAALPPKEEFEENDVIDHGNVADAWKEIVGSGLFGIDQSWDPMVGFGSEGGGSSGSTVSWDELLEDITF